MKVKTITFHCPSYCFAKPLPPTPPPRSCQPYKETEGSHHSSCIASPGSCDEKLEIDKFDKDGRKKACFLRSSLKKSCALGSKEAARECVKWMDDLGKELVEIREFEPTESEELDDEIYGYPTCTCAIL